MKFVEGVGICESGAYSGHYIFGPRRFDIAHQNVFECHWMLSPAVDPWTFEHEIRAPASQLLMELGAWEVNWLEADVDLLKLAKAYYFGDEYRPDVPLGSGPIDVLDPAIRSLLSRGAAVTCRSWTALDALTRQISSPGASFSEFVGHVASIAYEVVFIDAGQTIFLSGECQGVRALSPTPAVESSLESTRNFLKFWARRAEGRRLAVEYRARLRTLRAGRLSLDRIWDSVNGTPITLAVVPRWQRWKTTIASQDPWKELRDIDVR